MNLKQLVSVGTAVAFLGGKTFAFWRMECRGVSGQARIDPLVSPGTTSKHIHEIFGSAAFATTADYASLVAGNCTSCAVTADKSAYWTPIPYFQNNATGEYEVVNNVGGMLAYYFLNAAPYGNTSITAFPPGFRMIAGDNNRRNYSVGDGDFEQPDPPKSKWLELDQVSQKDLAQRAVGFNCLDYTKAAEGSLYRHFMPSKEYIDANCPEGLRFEVMFPSCWNGLDLDSHDHKSHVAYPDLVMNGVCPDEFPVRLPGLFFETIWDMHAFTDKTGIFVLSNGDPLGFGYHADFIMGWDQTNFTLQDAVDTCTSPSGEIRDCPLFNIQSEEAQTECHIELPAKLLLEEVAGPIRDLPGNVPVMWGPDAADGNGPKKGADPTTPIPAVFPTLTYLPAPTAAGDGGFVPGDALSVPSQPSAPPSPTDNNVPMMSEPALVTPGLTPETPPPTADHVDVDADAPVHPEALSAPTDPAPVDADAPVHPEALSAPTDPAPVDADGLVIVSEIVYEQVIDYVMDVVTETVYADAARRRRRVDHKNRHRHVHSRIY